MKNILYLSKLLIYHLEDVSKQFSAVKYSKSCLSRSKNSLYNKHLIFVCIFPWFYIYLSFIFLLSDGLLLMFTQENPLYLRNILAELKYTGSLRFPSAIFFVCPYKLRFVDSYNLNVNIFFVQTTIVNLALDVCGNPTDPMKTYRVRDALPASVLRNVNVLKLSIPCAVCSRLYYVYETIYEANINNVVVCLGYKLFMAYCIRISL